MINILSYVGMNMQSEVCLWTLLGLVRTIFDATLFKVNANLIQVWQMSMPEEMSLPVQHVLRTIISGIMLVQCFTVYVYLASYIVLLYPVFLEERPTLVLPWLLLAAIRKLLCPLTSLALGLGTCILVGPAKPPCIRFLIVKIIAILPAFYMWMLLYSYYRTLKLVASFKTFTAVLPPCSPDYGLELAVRRRRTKSLLGEEQLREKLVAGLYAEGPSDSKPPPMKLNTTASVIKGESSDSSLQENNYDMLQPQSATDNKYADINAFEDWLGCELIIPRGSDRILEQFAVMMLRIAVYLKRDGTDSINSRMFNTNVNSLWPTRENIESVDVTETPPHVANSRGPTASYLQEYPQIFMKKLSSELTQPDVCQIHNSSMIENSSSIKSVSSYKTCNKTNQEVVKKIIENAVDKLVLSRGTDFLQNNQLGIIASVNNSSHNIGEIDMNSKLIEQLSPEPSAPIHENNEESENRRATNLENENDMRVSLELLSNNSANTILTKEFNNEGEESKLLDVNNTEIATVNSEDFSSQQTTNQSDKT